MLSPRRLYVSPLTGRAMGFHAFISYLKFFVPLSVGCHFGCKNAANTVCSLYVSFRNWNFSVVLFHVLPPAWERQSATEKDKLSDNDCSFLFQIITNWCDILFPLLELLEWWLDNCVVLLLCMLVFYKILQYFIVLSASNGLWLFLSNNSFLWGGGTFISKYNNRLMVYYCRINKIAWTSSQFQWLKIP